MSATAPKPKPTEPSLTSKLPYYQINPSYTVRVICCVVFIFLTEICLAHYIYRLIKSEINEDFIAKRDFHQEFMNEIRSGIAKEEIQRILRELEFFEHQNARANATRRRKRDAFVVDDDNLLNLPNDGPNVEFFDPKLRGELEAKDALERQKNGNKGAAPGGDSWVWLTSYCRIPVSC
ncbi:hypothetical protein ILUMI_21409 [Ignelater luminosus]|uniref:Uncharacterized protein n=1 Tax=Ignelater luminosus TaxID=2038154 RepID=A0A8K0CEL7_IGNLU|nr:hypothetical protein ILUMI_21409 [Ignelater luminosus]